jgi:hypothetical protein
MVFIRIRDSSVDIVTGYRLDGQIPISGSFQTDPGSHPFSYPKTGFFPGGEAAGA